MKKALTTLAILAMSVFAAQAQYTTLGVGINPPVGTLHVHSATPTNPLYPPSGDNGDDNTDDLNPFLDNYESIIHVTNPNSGTTATDGFSIIQSDLDVTLRQFESGKLNLLTSGGGIIISSSGKVGIGSLNETYKLNVNGSSRFVGQMTISSGGLIVNGTLKVGSGFLCNSTGHVKVKELKVTTTDWPDYVFGDEHELKPLSEVECYIGENRHLEGLPTAKEVESEGLNVGEMNRLLVEKVEELTLYIIDLQKQIDELKTK